MFTARDLFKVAAFAAILCALGLAFRWGYRPSFVTTGETREAALFRDLVTLNKAVYLYREEHNGVVPDPARICQQLTRYTDASGNVGVTPDSYPLGPYLHSVPAIAIGPERGRTSIATAPAPGIAWIYNPTTGTIRGNCDEQPTGPQFQVPPPSAR